MAFIRKAGRRKVQEKKSMKILHAKGMIEARRETFIKTGMTVLGLLLYMWILPLFISQSTFFYIIVIITIILSIYLSGICPCIKIYCTHWIKYGNGKVIIKRVRKELVNGRPEGKWKKEEEEFLLEDLVSCGMSLPVLGEYVEFNPIMRGGISKECFFQLKNGKRLGCEIEYYTSEDLEGLFRFIYEETGVKLQENYVPAEDESL